MKAPHKPIRPPTCLTHRQALLPPFLVVGIGASSGGLEPCIQLLQSLPNNTGMACVIIQHLHPKHESLLPVLLARATKLPVQQVQEPVPIAPNQIYVIAPRTELVLEQGELLPLQRPKRKGGTMPIDAFFCSLAAQFQHAAIGIVLSGTGSDGTVGCTAIKAAGGITFAQDETAAHQEMPQHARAAGCIDASLPPVEIAHALIDLCAQQAVLSSPSNTASDQSSSEEQEALPIILQTLQHATGIDFTIYKPATITRRIRHWMTLRRYKSWHECMTAVTTSATEAEALSQDLLITVTAFFREPTAFQVLTTHIFPHILERAPPNEPVRVWAAGCATGEEVYSLAICWFEFLTECHRSQPIQIFGTDLNKQAIEQARTARYPPSALNSVSPERIHHFFVQEGAFYQVSPAIRECCVFAQQNVCQQPPFSRLDLLVCRNLLIYLHPAIQYQLMHLFHHALKPYGFLLLGQAETVGEASDLFLLVEKKQKVYCRKETQARPIYKLGFKKASTQQAEEEHPMANDISSPGRDPLQEADCLLLDRYAPASIVIDADLQILQFRGRTSPYLEPASGKASLSLLKIVHQDLVLDLRRAIYTARKSGQLVKQKGILVTSGDTQRLVTMNVHPLPAPNTAGVYLIVFTEKAATPSQPSTPAPLAEEGAEVVRSDYAPDRLATLERDLVVTRNEMHAMIKEQEAINEELQSANQEALSSNEELQSINEELETSKEEIEASNEELQAANQALQARGEQLKEMGEYANAIVETIREPLVVLNSALHVQRANATFYQIFQIMPAAAEQQSFYDLSDGLWNVPTIRGLLEEVLPNQHVLKDVEIDLTIPSGDSKTLLLNARRLTWKSNPSDLILLVMEDITDRRKLERQKDTFMAIASHELKTPITALKGYTQLLERRREPAGDERFATMLKAMNGQVDRLTHLVEDFLDVTRLEAGQFPLREEPVDVDKLVQTTVQECQRTTDTHQLLIKGAAHTILQTDRERFGQILTNLLSNAIKYSPQARQVIVQIQAEADMVTLSVQDFGMGIPADEQEHVFERFFRVGQSRWGMVAGLGLGLYISSEIIKRLGGRMWVQSCEGAGSTFFLELPVQRVPTVARIQDQGAITSEDQIG